MSRRIAGALAAAAAAPYLGAVFYFLLSFLEDIRVSDLPSLSGAGDLLGLMLIVGTYGLLIYGWFVFPAACLASFIIDRLGAKSMFLIIGAGALIGFGFGSYLQHFEPWKFISGLTLSGALCGWIYWCIAVGRRSTCIGARHQEEV